MGLGLVFGVGNFEFDTCLFLLWCIIISSFVALSLIFCFGVGNAGFGLPHFSLVGCQHSYITYILYYCTELSSFSHDDHVSKIFKTFYMGGGINFQVCLLKMIIFILLAIFSYYFKCCYTNLIQVLLLTYRDSLWTDKHAL